MRATLAILPLLGLIDRQLGFEPRRELIKLSHPTLTMLCGLSLLNYALVLGASGTRHCTM